MAERYLVQNCECGAYKSMRMCYFNKPCMICSVVFYTEEDKRITKEHYNTVGHIVPFGQCLNI